MKVVRLLALGTGRLYLHTSRNIPGTHLCYGLSRSKGNSAVGRIVSMTPSGNRTRDLPACSTVPQTTAPPTACPKQYICCDIKHRYVVPDNPVVNYTVQAAPGGILWGRPRPGRGCRVGTGSNVRQHTQTSSNSSTIAADSNNGVTNTRRCRYSCLRSWWWVEVPLETCRTVFRYK